MDRDFEDFFRTEYDSVRRALVVALRDRAFAEDAAQKGFLEAFAHWRRVRRMDRPAGWVYVAAIRYARRKRSDLFGGTVDTVTPDPADAVTATLDLALLVGLLPPRQRLAIVLRYWVDLPLREVAEAMGCAEGTVKATLHAAIRNLRIECCAQDDLEACT